MAHIRADRTQETSTTTGTSALTLAGAVSYYRAFSAVMADTDTCVCLIQNASATEWELSLCTYASGSNTLTRSTIYASNTGAIVSFGAGTKTISLVPVASKMVVMDNSGDAVVTNDLAVGGALTAVVVSTLAEFQALTSTPAAVILKGSAAAYDGWGGLFVRISGSVTAADNALVIRRTAGGDSYKRLYSDLVNVQWYGARGDGLADDTTAFTNAFATTKDVFVPPGVFLIASKRTVTAQGLIGAGPTSIIRASGSSFNMFKLSGSGCRVRNLTFQGAATTNGTIQNAIETDTSSIPTNFEISGCHFGGPSSSVSLNNGIYMPGNGEAHFRIFGNHFENLIGTVSGTGYGVLTGAVTDGVISGNTFIGIRGTHGRHAIYYCAGAKRLVIQGNVVNSFNSAALTGYSTDSQTACEDILIDGNVMTLCGLAAETDGAIWVGGKSKRVRVSNNIISKSYSSGIVMDNYQTAAGFSDLVIDGNIITDSDYDGILTYGPVNQVISRNTIHGTSLKSGSAQTYWDIILAPTGTGGQTNQPTQSLVSGNQCRAVAATSRAPFTSSLNGAVVKCWANDFPTTDYFTGPLYANTTNTVWIDGRLQYIQGSVNPPSIPAAQGYVLGAIAMSGASQGDLAIASFTTDMGGVGTGGIALTAQVYATGFVQVIFSNISGTAIDLASGTLRIDVFKRDGYNL